MPAGRFVADYRVSTAKQGQSGLGLEAQRAAVLDYMTRGKWALLAEFTEVESGKRRSAGTVQGVRSVQATGSVLVIAKLDRLSRDACFLLGLEKAGIEFVACDMPNANRLTVGIMAVVAQEERRMISERTRAALQAARERGVRLTRHGSGDRSARREGRCPRRYAGASARSVRRHVAAPDRY